MDIEAIKAALLFGGSSGDSDFEQLANRPKINDNLIDKNSTNASLGISKTYTLNNTTIAGHIVFDIPVETITDIYNMMVKGAVCILSDTPGNIHRLVSSADTDGDNVYVIVQYDDILIRYVDDGTHTYKERIEVDENLSDTSTNPVMNKTLTVELSKKQNKLTQGDNITIENNRISSYQETAKNPYKLTYTSGNGTDAYDGSVPKMITLEKLNGASKDFVNSSIATNTAFFKGTFDSFAELPTTDVTNNDYAFVVGEDEAGNTTYTRYKYSTELDDENQPVGWIEEYVLNNSSFTAEQWATIQSGITENDVTQIATNTSAIADLTADMPDSPEDVNAQPVTLTIEAEADEDLSITITDSRYVSGGTVNYLQLYTDSVAAFNGGTDVVIRITVGGEIVLDLKCNCFNGHDLVFEGHNIAAVIVVAMSSSSVEVVAMYDIEPSESLDDADDGQLTTAKAQKDYFQTKITSSNKIPYSNISGTPTIPAAQVNADWNATAGVSQILNKPTIPAAQQQTNWNSTSGITSIANKPSNFVLGYSGTTSTASALKIVTCTQAQYDSSSKSADTVYLIKS